MIKPILLALAAISGVAAAPAFAEDANPLSFNAGIVSDYRYRGISQSRRKPAAQAGVDYALPGGFYVGAWGSTIRWIKDNGVRGPVEIDLYGGYKGEIQKDFGYDVGVLQYWYARNKLADTGGGGVYKNANTTELYGALSYGPVSAKLSYALTDLFGNHDFANGRKSRGSTYAELNGSFDIGAGFTLAPHLGHQDVRHIAHASYTDYSATVSHDVVPGVAVSVAFVGSNADRSFYVPGAPANSSKFLGKRALVVGLKATF